MPGALSRYLSDDHNRRDALLQRAVAKPGVVDMVPYGEFRKGLLRHIGVEEKIVLPAIERLQGGRRAAVADRLRLDHGALVALMVPQPSPSIIATLRSILQVHNVLEEQEGGLYQLYDELAGSDTEMLLGQMKAAPEVPVTPYNERPIVLEATRRAVERAGYTFHNAPR